MSKSFHGAKRRLTVIAGLMALTLVTVAVVAAALLRSPDASHPRDGEMQAKADAFVKQVADEQAAEVRAALVARTVLVRPKAAGQALRVLYAGDSITAGYGATGAAKSFRELTLAALRKEGKVEPAVAGEPGQTTAEAAPAVSAAGEGFDLVVVELGTNDTIKTPSISTFTSDYRALIAEIRAKSPKAALICAGAWNEPKKANPYDAVIESTCKASGGQYRALNGFFTTEINRWVDGVMPDGTEIDNFHPSDTGHKAIAQQLMTAVRYS